MSKKQSEKKHIRNYLKRAFFGVWALGLLPVFCPVDSNGQVIPDQLPEPANKAPAKDKPVKVYILSGQSNMVGMGDVSGGGRRWGTEFLNPVVSLYPGPYDPDADYDKMKPTKTKELPKFGGVHPTPFPEGQGTYVVRGHIKMNTTGVYQFRPGYGGSTHNIMTVNGVEVHRKEVGEKRQHKNIKLVAGEEVPFKIIYLTDAANGLGWWARIDIPGTLNTVVKQNGEFPWLIDENGNWTVRNDVMYKGVVSDTWKGPLTVADNSIGPELGFGHVLGYYHDEPVLLIKASIGNRSLGWDILPPGSERYTYEGRVYAGYKDSPASWPQGEKPEPINWYAGKTYDRYTQNIHDILNNFDKLFPQFKGQGYEIAGFVWWQGHKDGGSAAHISRYEKNLANLIKAWRKEFNAPDAPWAIATVGFGGHEMQDKYRKILQAQMAVANPEKHPEFAGTVTTVDIRDFWRKKENSPSGQGYHYNRNAETYYLVGDALGRAMVGIKAKN